MKVILQQCALVLQQTLCTPHSFSAASEDSLLISLNCTVAATASSMNLGCCQLLCNKDLFPKTLPGQQTIIWWPLSSLAEEKSQFERGSNLARLEPAAVAPQRPSALRLFVLHVRLRFVCVTVCAHSKQKGGRQSSVAPHLLLLVIT